MTSTDLDQALQIISQKYEESISNYLHKIIRAEFRGSSLEAAEVISIAFVVLDRAKQMYNASRGPFRNYAIRALRNEFIRFKNQGIPLYEDFQFEDSQVSYENQLPESSGLSAQFENTSNSVEYSITKQQTLQATLAVSASILNLSPTEQALLYFTYYSTDSVRINSVREIAEKFQLSYYKLTRILHDALSKIERELA